MCTTLTLFHSQLGKVGVGVQLSRRVFIEILEAVSVKITDVKYLCFKALRAKLSSRADTKVLPFVDLLSDSVYCLAEEKRRMKIRELPDFLR